MPAASPRTATGCRMGMAMAMASKFLIAVLSQDKIKGLLSSEHFSVEGTLLEAGPGAKSFRPKDGSGEPPVRAEPRADHPRPITLAADKVYDTGDFIMELRERAVTPHV